MVQLGRRRPAVRRGGRAPLSARGLERRGARRRAGRRCSTRRVHLVSTGIALRVSRVPDRSGSGRDRAGRPRRAPAPPERAPAHPQRAGAPRPTPRACSSGSTSSTERSGLSRPSGRATTLGRRYDFARVRSDSSADPGTDFYRFANGGWLDANPIPAGYGAWGSFEEVSRRNEVVLRELLERGARPSPPTSSTGCSATRSPPAWTWRRSRPPGSSRSRRCWRPPSARTWRRCTGPGSSCCSAGGVTADHDDPDRNLLWLSRPGSGCPTASPTSTTARRKELRAAYVEHIAAQLAQRGRARATARRCSPSRPASPSCTGAPRSAATPTAPTTATTARRWSRWRRGSAGYLDRARRRRRRDASTSRTRGCSKACKAVLDDTAPATLRAYFSFHVVKAVADALPARIDDEDFAFYGRRIRGQKEQHERTKRVIDAIGADLGEALAQRYVATDVLARGQGARRAHGRGDRRGDAGVDPHPRVDGRRDPQARRGQARRAARQDRLPRPLARVGRARDRPRHVRRQPPRRRPLRARAPAGQAAQAGRPRRVGDAARTSSTPTTTRRSTRSSSRPASCSRRCSTPRPTTPSTSAASAW